MKVVDNLMIKLFLWYMRKHPLFSELLIQYLYKHYKKEIHKVYLLEESEKFMIRGYDA